MSSTQLITKYRPKRWADVVGNRAVVDSLKKKVEYNDSQCFLFGGSPGFGKTTMAELVAQEFECTDRIEHDGGRVSGVDAMRDLLDLIRYRPLDGANRAIMINECHALSAQAWNSILVSLENPEPFNYWFFTTNLPNKVPAAVQQRCATYILKATSNSDLTKLLEWIALKENADVPEDVISLCVDAAYGSPRAAVANLSKTMDCATTEEARELLVEAGEIVEGIDLARALVKGTDWATLLALVKDLESSKIESVRYTVVNYVSRVFLSNPLFDRNTLNLKILRAFSTPFPPNEGHAPLILALDAILNGD